MCAPGDFRLFFPETLLSFGNEYKDCLFCQFDLENDETFL